MTRTHHRSPLRIAASAGVLALTLAATMVLGPAAWADETGQQTTGQQTAGQQTTGQQGTGQQGTGQQGTGQQTTGQMPAATSIAVSVTPRKGRPGTTVELVADVRRCDQATPIKAYFNDSKNQRSDLVHAPKQLARQRVVEGWFSASYTVTKSDAVGRGVFTVECSLGKDHYGIGTASFKVRPATTADSTGSATAKDVKSKAGSVPVPSRIDTGLGGTAEGADTHSGIEPVWLALPAGLLLLGLAFALGRVVTKRQR